jgi:nucleoside phosphorylase
MVGIGGGAPDDHDIRLGDIVVSEPTTRYGGVMQYDRGKAIDGGRIRALLGLEAQHLLRANNVRLFYDEAMRRYPELRAIAEDPGRDADQLFVAEYSHVLSQPSCHECDPTMLRQRPPRPDDHPRIFYGLIASGNKVIKDATVRDQLAKEYGILYFETEAAGIMDIFPCLVIRGVCDYSDSHKKSAGRGMRLSWLLHIPESSCSTSHFMTLKDWLSTLDGPNERNRRCRISNFLPVPISTGYPLQPIQEDTWELISSNSLFSGPGMVHPDISGNKSSTPVGHGSGDHCKHRIHLTQHESKTTHVSDAAAHRSKESIEIYNLSTSGRTSELAAKLQEPGVKDSINYFHPTEQRTPLGIAVFKRDLTTAELLLAHKAGPDGRRKGRPPLWTAFERRRTKYNVEERLIQLLLDHGADPNVPSTIASEEGSTPLMKAVQTRKSLQTISRLVDRRADTSKAAKLREAEANPEVLNALQPHSKDKSASLWVS